MNFLILVNFELNLPTTIILFVSSLIFSCSLVAVSQARQEWVLESDLYMNSSSAAYDLWVPVSSMQYKYMLHFSLV